MSLTEVFMGLNKILDIACTGYPRIGDYSKYVAILRALISRNSRERIRNDQRKIDFKIKG